MNINIVIKYGTGCWIIQAAYNVKQGAFSTAGGPHYGDKVTLEDGHRRSLQRSNFTFARAINF